MQPLFTYLSASRMRATMHFTGFAGTLVLACGLCLATGSGPAAADTSVSPQADGRIPAGAPDAPPADVVPGQSPQAQLPERYAEAGNASDRSSDTVTNIVLLFGAGLFALVGIASWSERPRRHRRRKMRPRKRRLY